MQHNLERDMKDAKWFVDKVRSSESYSQNLYAALCNNAFQKLDVIPILKDEVWSCTWRSAGGIVADIRCEGNYMDWYCSGIHDTGLYNEDGLTMELSEEQLANMTMLAKYVPESIITQEIREDFKQLGWTVIEDYHDSGT